MRKHYNVILHYNTSPIFYSGGPEFNYCGFTPSPSRYRVET